MQCSELPFHQKSTLPVQRQTFAVLSLGILWGKLTISAFVWHDFQMIIQIFFFPSGKPGTPGNCHGGTNDGS